jgi:glycerophosphoryl diester phosphodiesterase
VAPENTLSAFAAALESGADGLELDIHLSRDGVPVVIHDETLERTTDGRGAVVAVTLPQLQKLDAGSWFSAAFAGEAIPTLAEVLKIFGGQLRLNLELKEFHAGVAVLALLRDYPAAEVVLSSFDYALLTRLRAMDDDVPLAVLLDSGNWRQAVQVAKELSACAFHPAVNQLHRPMVDVCIRAGIPVSVWTVDDVGVARSLIRAGVTGLFTNDPGTLCAAF